MRRPGVGVGAAVVAAAVGVALLAVGAPPGVLGVAPSRVNSGGPALGFSPTAAPTPGTTAGPGGTLAAAEIQDLGRSALYRRSYAGLTLADPGEVVVYRLPDAAFDDAVGRIAGSYRVRVRLRAAEISYAQMQALSAEISHRRDALRAAGAPVVGVAIKPAGRVTVQVNGDPGVARDLLRDLRHVDVEAGSGYVPL